MSDKARKTWNSRSQQPSIPAACAAGWPSLVGSPSSFAQGRQQLELLAGLTVTTKAVERHAEAIGADRAARQQAEIHRALQRPLPEAGGEPIRVLYVEIDGSGVPVVPAEIHARPGKPPGEPAHTREAKFLSLNPSPRRNLLLQAVERNLDYIRVRSGPRNNRRKRKHLSSSDRRPYRDINLI